MVVVDDHRRDGERGNRVAARDSHVGGWNSLINKQQLYAENLAIAEGIAP